jgi:hypothetical protein
MTDSWKLLLVSFWDGRTPVRLDWFPDRHEIEQERGAARTVVAEVRPNEDGIVMVLWPDGRSPYPDPLTAKIEDRVRILSAAQRDGRMCTG